MKSSTGAPRLAPVLLVLCPAVALALEKGPLDYNRQVRPILSNNCFQCHGPDRNQRKADLRLDLREEALARKAIVPGAPDRSPLVARVFSSSQDDIMPPPEAHKSLTEEQKGLLRRWVAEGAPYAAHWAYVLPRRASPPETRASSWVRTPIDSFVLAELEAKGVSPSPEASSGAILRRLHLDLIGLPPGPEEVASYRPDADPSAYERRVEDLLQSPHFGERMAVFWLDLARFADSVGYHGDQLHRASPYRDYVIQSFNDNLPFDQFTLEQLAGDLLPGRTENELVATAFNRLNMMTREGGAQPGEYLAKYAGDRVRTVSLTWLGSTMGCCECHDHKYDPFTTRDFYSLAAFFADVKQWGVYQDYAYTPNPELRGWSNDHPFPPEIEVDSPYLLRRRRLLEERLEEQACKDAGPGAGASPDLETWRLAVAGDLLGSGDGWQVVPLEAGPADHREPSGALVLGGAPKGGDLRRAVLSPQGPRTVASLRLEALPHEAHGGKLARGGRASARMSLEGAVVAGGQGERRAIKFLFADADRAQPRYFNGEAIPGVLGGWTTDASTPGQVQTSVWILDPPLELGAGEQLELVIRSDDAGCLRLAASRVLFLQPKSARLPGTLRAALLLAPGARAPSEERALRTAWILSTCVKQGAFDGWKRLLGQMFECGNGRVMSLVTEGVAPRTVRVLPRGNWQDESGPVVMPAVPAFLRGPPAAASTAAPADPAPPARATRLDLARWITSRENPLTARVLVNRLWKLFFGAGICTSVDDFGAQGDAPSHPELLDWLALELVDSGWNVKHLVRLMVLSATYRQRASLRPELRDLDPQNRLLASQNPRRLDAEFVRDNALAIAGLLDLEIGGPSARPYQPAGYYSNLQFPDREYQPQLDDRQYRRGVYVHWQRTFLHPMLANFDAPSREECVASRVVSNTPQQALTLLNDPTFVEAARVLAAHLLSSPGLDKDSGRLDEAYRRALCRAPSDRERVDVLRFLESQRGSFRADPAAARKLLQVGLAPTPDRIDAVELAAWTSVTRVLLNLHEVITR